MRLKYEHGISVNKENLFMVINSHDNTSMLLYFNADDVKNYSKANEVVQNKFNALLSDQVEFARQQGQAGIKKLKDSSAEVEFSVNGKKIKKSITYEIKITKSAARIGLMTLEPTDHRNPTLLVATLFMEDGLHKGKSKKYCKQAYSLDKHGLFKHKRPEEYEQPLRSITTLARGF